MRLELTRRGDYAVRTMLALAEAGPASLSARRIAGRMAIPSRFLPHVLRDLLRANLIEARIGRTGGYRLATSPDRVSLLEIVHAAEGDPPDPTCILGGGPCAGSGTCAVHEAFAAGRAAMTERLATTTLAQVASRS